MAAGSLKGKGMNESRYAAGKRDMGKDFFKSGPGDAAAPKMNMDNAKAMRFAKGGRVKKFSGGGSEDDVQYERMSSPPAHHVEIDRELAAQKKTSKPSGKQPTSAFGKAYAEARAAGKKDFEWTRPDGSKYRVSTISKEEKDAGKRATKYADKTDSAPVNTPEARAERYGKPEQERRYRINDNATEAYKRGDASYDTVKGTYDRAKETWDYNQAGYKKGGAVKHDDAAQDRKLIASMIRKEEKKEAPMKKAMGGAAKVRKGVI